MSAERYTLIRRIATGGMAEVWKATASGAAGFAKTVAIKRILPGFASDAEFVERFIAEARVAAALVHPNIVQVFDFGELEPGVYFLAMEFVPGVDAWTLARHAFEEKANGGTQQSTGAALVPGELSEALPPQLALHLCMETARGLGYAHTRKPSIIHRDVSPQNILVSFDGDVKLADFGIAKVSGSATAASVVKGKLAYMSPEQVRGESVDARSDLFSLGVTLYRLLTARHLFKGDTVGERLAALSSYRGVSDEALSHVPDRIHPVLLRSLSPNPKTRFADAAEMEAALGDALGTAATVTIRRALAGYTRECEPETWRTEQRESSRALTDKRTGSSLSRMTAPPPQSGRGRWIALAAGAAAILGGIAIGPSLIGGGTTPSPTPTPLAAREPATATATPAVTETAAAPAPSAAATLRPIARDVATWDVTFLDGCTDAELALADTSIRSAIRRGLPLYNKGDTAACFRLYEETARSIRDALPESCSGPRAALAQAVARADRLGGTDEKAFAIRDAFDGLLNVMTKRRRPG